jgi:hypothetical protein
MAYVELTPLQKNSLPAKTTSLLADDGVSVEVDDQSVFYRGGSLLTKGWVLGPDNAVDSYTEEITVSATDDVTGDGTVTISARAVKADGTNGAAREWPIGTTIKNTYTTGTHDQVIDNFIEHATLITARATKTTAAMSVYVDAAATGAGDGTSWTDAFTTIQAAIDSLSTVLEHAVTVYIRKGASAYAGASVAQLIGKGSLVFAGEYYWNGQCATATDGASTTKFNTIAHTDGANIEVGDHVLVTYSTGGAGAYNYYILSTVKAVTDEGSNIHQIELNNAADWGNIGAGSYYTIVKTEISGGIGATNSTGWSLRGVYANYMYITRSEISDITCVIFDGAASQAIRADYNSIISGISSSYIGGANHAVMSRYLSFIYINPPQSAATACVIAQTSGAYPALYTLFSYIYCRGSIIKGTATGYGVQSTHGSTVWVSACTITTGTGTGIIAQDNSVVIRTTVTNSATTPLNPASSTANPVII